MRAPSATNAERGRWGKRTVPERIITILNNLSRDLGIPVITAEYEIVLSLIDRPGLTAQTLLSHSSLSSTGFFATLDRLKHLNVVQCAASRWDKRVRLYSLEPSMADLVVSRFAEYGRSRRSSSTLNLREEELRAQSHYGRRAAKIDHLTAPYQILLYLYLMSDMTNSQLMKIVHSSTTKINVTLKELGAKGLICCRTDATDRRRKHYQLCGAARQAIDKSNSRVFDWLDLAQRRTLPAKTPPTIGNMLGSAETKAPPTPHIVHSEPLSHAHRY